MDSEIKKKILSLPSDALLYEYTKVCYRGMEEIINENEKEEKLLMFLEILRRMNNKNQAL